MLVPILVKVLIFTAIGWVIHKFVKIEPVRTVMFIVLAIVIIIWLCQVGGIRIP